MENLVRKLKQDHPGLVFSLGNSLCWSPGRGQISYPTEGGAHAIEGLLHEMGHARLGHKAYRSDLELLHKEVEAWQEALRLARTYRVTIDQNHMQDCLDTYRDWLYKRSMCPMCTNTGLQESEQRYACLNCKHAWQVTASRLCRPYRRSGHHTHKEKTEP